MTTPQPDTIIEVELDALRRRYLDALATLDEAHGHLRRALDDAASALHTVRDHIETGGRISDYANIITPAPLRASLTNALNDLERARHHAQRLLFRILETEGNTKSDIARAWGISRQLVSRLINEPD